LENKIKQQIMSELSLDSESSAAIIVFVSWNYHPLAVTSGARPLQKGSYSDFN
jgi:hypothetical protein